MRHPIKIRTALGAQGLAIILLAGILLAVSSTIQLRYQRDELLQGVELRAQNEITAKGSAILNMMTAVEVAVRNHVWDAERLLSNPDSMFAVTTRLVEANSNIVGSSASFTPNFYPSKGALFEPYSVRDSVGNIVTMQLASDSHNYTMMDFFRGAFETDSVQWSEPYMDIDGAGTMLTTFSAPIHNEKGVPVAVLDADVTLAGISSLMEHGYYFPSTYSFLISPKGNILTWGVDSTTKHTVDNKLIDEIHKSIESGQQVLKTGGIYKKEITDGENHKSIAFFSPIEGKRDWSIALIYSNSEVFGDYQRMRLSMIILWFIGISMLICIILLSIKNIKRLQKITVRDERRGSELRIARNIQMGMIPKPESSNRITEGVEIYGSLEPAKEVGGDLYDYVIKNDKLYFCIGDVSGKGVPASLLMAVTRSLFRTSINQFSDSGSIVSSINTALSDFDESSMFVTLFTGCLNIRTGELNYCNAGHNPPLLISKGLTALPVDVNLPVGVIKNFEYKSQNHVISNNDTLFLYTDGITEAKDIYGTLYGEKRLTELLENLSDKNPHELINSVSESLKLFVGNAEQADDITLLAIRRVNNKATSETDSKYRIELDCKLEQIRKAEQFVSDILSPYNLSESEIFQIRLAVEEITVNIINYAYDEQATGKIVIEGKLENRILELNFIDNGSPFNPTTNIKTNINAPLEERDIGGLGIHLVTEIMDEVIYNYTEGKNILTIRKKLNN